MIILISLLLIMSGFYLLFLVSEKQRSKTLKTKLDWLVKNMLLTRIFSIGLFSVAIFLLCDHYGTSIGWVSFFIFASPLIFVLILYCNNLKQKVKTNTPKVK